MALTNAQRQSRYRATQQARMNYSQALEWLLDNDDCSWIWDDRAVVSIAAGFVADCYGRSTDQVIQALRDASNA